MDWVSVASAGFLVFLGLIVGGVVPLLVEAGAGGDLSKASGYVVSTVGRSAVVLMGVGAVYLVWKRADNQVTVIVGLAMILGLELVMPVI